MNGRILYKAPTPSPKHKCVAPPAAALNKLSAVEVVYPAGSVWECPCGQTWVVSYAQGRRWSWRRERKRERRRREKNGAG